MENPLREDAFGGERYYCVCVPKKEEHLTPSQLRENCEN